MDKVNNLKDKISRVYAWACTEVYKGNRLILKGTYAYDKTYYLES